MNTLWTLIPTVIGLYLIAMGTISFLKHRKEMGQAVPVRLRVIALHEERDSNDDTVHVPEYEILDSAHTGTKVRSRMGEPRPLHQPGEEIDGLYDAGTKAIMSLKERPFFVWMPIWMIGFGAVALALPMLWS